MASTATGLAVDRAARIVYVDNDPLVLVHARALLMALLKRKASWTVTNARSGVLPGIELVLPHVGLLLLNAVAIGVGLAVSAVSVRQATRVDPALAFGRN